MTEARQDKAALLWNLRADREAAVKRLPRKSGFMLDVQWHGIDRLERQIALVRSVPTPKPAVGQG